MLTATVHSPSDTASLAIASLPDTLDTPTIHESQAALIATAAKPPPYPGLLIAIEGIDGTGKSTQARLLADAVRQLDAFRDREIVLTKEPTDGPIGQRIRATAITGRLPVEEELALFMEDRRQHVNEVIVPALQRGAVVIVDRYYFSSAAYQGARGLDWREVLRMNEVFAPRPDVLFVLDAPVEVGLERIGKRGLGGSGGNSATDEFEQRESLEAARTIFLMMVEELPCARLMTTRLPRDETTQRMSSLTSILTNSKQMLY